MGAGPRELLIEARHAAELSRQELAARARTSRPTLSAYEHGRKSPTLDTTARLPAETGFELASWDRPSTPRNWPAAKSWPCSIGPKHETSRTCTH
ncbi:helix-turn-helix transcriptional regulator [Amycolatopsis sp. NBC_00345]|uniref:helix-turn-helix transcriptional regulator n=1 Tax=Amycolatopsis sp. NBC_00345 TaxID=2975955 RepID=UPI002E27717D